MNKRLHFLHKDFEVNGNDMNSFVKDIKFISKNTEIVELDPGEITIYSVASGSTYFKNNEEVLRIYHFYPDECDLQLYSRNGLPIKYLLVEKLIEQGFTREMIDNVIQAGAFYGFPNKDGWLYAAPSTIFLSSLCKSMGIGKLIEGINPMRDMYLGTILADSPKEKIKIMVRKSKSAAKAFSCFSSDYKEIPQADILNLIDTANKRLGNTDIFSYHIDHEITSVDVIIPSKNIESNGNIISCGYRFCMSDTGCCAFKLYPLITVGKNAIVMPNGINKKRSEITNLSDFMMEFLDKAEEDVLNGAVKMVEMIEKTSDINALKKVSDIMKKSAIMDKIGSTAFKKTMEEVSKTDGSSKDAAIKLLSFSEMLNLPYYRKVQVQEIMGDLIGSDKFLAAIA